MIIGYIYDINPSKDGNTFVEKQLNEILNKVAYKNNENEAKESAKNIQLEIDFNKVEKEIEEQPKKLNVDKYKKLTKDELIKILIEIEQKFEEFEKCANEKYSELFGKYNQLLVKENKQYHIIQNLKGTVSMLEESNGKLVNDYNFLQRLYNGIKESCIRWKNEAINYQYKLRKYQLFDDLF